MLRCLTLRANARVLFGASIHAIALQKRSARANLKSMMNRLPNAADLTPPEYSSLRLVARGFMSKTIPKLHQARLIELGLIQCLMGGLMATPAGRMVARS
jgi:hypothetical protein